MQPARYTTSSASSLGFPLRWMDRAQRMSATGVVCPSDLVNSKLTLATAERALLGHDESLIKAVVEVDNSLV